MSTSTQDKTILGYHDKNNDKYGILKYKSLPIFIEERYAPFLITRDHIWTTSTEKILNLLNNYQALKKFRKIKNVISNILVIPGIIVAIIYILQIFNIWEIEIFEKLMNISFWLAVLGIIILWHDYYRTKSFPIKLPQIEPIPLKEKNRIKDYNIQFSRYINMESTHFISEELLELIQKNILGENFNTFTCFEEMLKDEFILEILNRSELLDLKENFEKYDIGSHTLPKYHKSGLRNLIIYATESALHTKSKEIFPSHFFIAFFKTFPVLQDVLKKEKNTIYILEQSTKFLIQKDEKKNVHILDINTPYYKNNGYVGDLIYGWDSLLKRFSTDINLEVSKTKELFGIGHEKNINNLITTISKLSNNNALLIGDPGSGKSSVILGLAQKINNGDVPRQIKDKKIIQLKLNSLIRDIINKEDFKEIIDNLMKEIYKSKDIILYIDEINSLIPKEFEKKQKEIAEIIKPYIIDSPFPVVGTINYLDYKKFFHSSEVLEESFENIELENLSAQGTLEVLTTKLPSLEFIFQTYIPISTLISTIEFAQRYIHDRHLPDSAVSLLENTCSWAQENNVKRINSEYVAKSISIKYSGESIKTIDASEATRLMEIEENIKKKIIGQDQAISEIVETIKKRDIDSEKKKKPIGVFLFLGPTGVGKTYLAKVIAEEYFGKEDDLVRIDMQDYQDEKFTEKNIGELINRVKRKPKSVILFDEIEKANPKNLNMFLEIIEEGKVESAGDSANLKNSIVILTSKIGSDIILESISKEQTLLSEAKDRALIELKQAIPSELFNKFDNIIVFSKQDISNLKLIADLELQKLSERLKEKNININWDEAIITLIANKTFDPSLGSRPIKRFIQKNIEGRIAEEIIAKKITPNEEINIKESWINI